MSARACRIRRLSVLRGWLHDLVCQSGCDPSDGDHARRTQHGSAVALERATDEQLPRAIHDVLCLAFLRSHRTASERGCRHTSGELDLQAYENAAAGLRVRLAAVDGG